MGFNVVKTIINYPFGNGFYHLFMVIWAMVYYCFHHVNVCLSIVGHGIILDFAGSMFQRGRGIF